MTRRETLLWCAAACVPVLVGLSRSGGPALSEDSYQYLSAASNLAAGHGVSTSIVHYDIDRRMGAMPASLTTWPPGYPAVVAAVHALGVPLEWAAVLISALAFVALVPLIAWSAASFGLTAFSTRLALVWLLANSWSFAFPSAVVTESLFTALAMAALVTFARSAHRESSTTRRAALTIASVLVGLAYWIRYAGLLLIAGVVACYGVSFLKKRDRASVEALVFAAGPAALLVAVQAVRSLLLAGSWTGGHEKPVTHALVPVLKTFAASVHHLFLGGAVAARVGVAEVVVVSAGAALVVAFLRAATGGRAGMRPGHWRALGLLTSVLVVYAAGMMYVGLFVAVTFDTRLFYPLLPPTLVGIAAAFSAVERARTASGARASVIHVAAVVATIAYVALNSRSIAASAYPAPHQRVEARLASLMPWLRAEVPAAATVVATDGQATAYALRRPTVSLTPAEISDTAWTEDRVRDVMASYNAPILILYPRADATQNPVQAESAFLTALLHGSVPRWLELAAENDDVKIFRRRR